MRFLRRFALCVSLWGPLVAWAGTVTRTSNALMLDTRPGDLTVDLRQPVEGELALRLSTVWDAGSGGSLCINGMKSLTTGPDCETDLDLITLDYRDWYFLEWKVGDAVYTRMLRVSYASKPVAPFREMSAFDESNALMLDTRTGDLTLDMGHPVEGERTLRLSTVWDAASGGSLCVNGSRLKTTPADNEQDFELSTADYRDWYFCEWTAGGKVYTRMLRVAYPSKPVRPYEEMSATADSNALMLDTRTGDLTIDLSAPVEGERVLRLSTVWDTASGGSLCINGVGRKTLGSSSEEDLVLTAADCISRCFCEWTVGGKVYLRTIRPVFSSAPSASGKTTVVSAPLRLDTMRGVREVADYWGCLTYDASWYDGVSRVKVQECSDVLAEGTRGRLDFARQACGYNFALYAVDANGASRICETARFAGGDGVCESAVTKEAVEPTSATPGSTAELTCIHCGKVTQPATVRPALGYVRNVTARQLWPFRAVEVCYELAEDIADVTADDPELVLSCAYGVTGFAARTVLGDTRCMPGFHRVVWDLGEDGFSYSSLNTVFKVKYGGGARSSEPVPVNVLPGAEDGFTLGARVPLGFSPIDANEAKVLIDGETVLVSCEPGEFEWTPRALGTHVLSHVAGTNVWTRTVNVTEIAFAIPPAPNPPTAEDANIKIGSSARSMTAAGGTVSITTSGSGTWNATTSVDWLTFNGASSKSAGMSCIVRVAANAGVESRTGYVYVSGHVFTVTQAGVGAELDSYAASFGSEGGEGEVLVLAGGQSSWNVTAGSDWISVRETSGTGEAYVHFTVAPFAGVSDRTGYLTIAGRTYEVHQVGRALSISHLTDEFDYESHVVEIDVSAFSSTEWYVAPFGSWISVVAPGEGLSYGSGKVMLAVNENPSYLPRAGYVTIGTERYDITQAGRPPAALSFAISPEQTTASVNGANGLIAVSATPDLPWTAESQANWLTVMPTFREGAGDGNVVYTATPNSTMSERTGTIVVSAVAASGKGSKTHTVVQPAAVASIAVEDHVFAAEGDSFELEVTVDDNVNWAIGGALGESALPSWVSVDGEQDRIGPGKVKIAVSENQEVDGRTATITVAGHAFTIVQRGRTVEVEYVSRVFDAEGGDGTLEIHPNGMVDWTAVSSELWLTIWAEDGAFDNPDGSVSGSSDGTIGYYVDPYIGDGEALTATITIGDKVVYITQRAYEAGISPSAATVSGHAGEGEFGFSASIDDVWTALDILCSKDWITTAQVTAFNAATKSGTIRYAYTANDSGVPRTGTIVVAGEAYQLTQSARRVARIDVEVEGGGGEVTGGGDYDVGVSVTLTATPADGFEFLGWYKGDSPVSAAAQFVFTASVNAKYTAKFAAIPTYVVNGQVVRRGTVVSCTAPADRIDDAGTTKLVCRGTSAYPEKGANFTLVASEDVAFDWDLWTTNYLVTADGVASWCAAGSVKTLTPKVPGGKTFFRWTGDVTSAEADANPLRLIVDGPKTVTSVSGMFTASLVDALDEPALTFRTGGDGMWAAAVDALAGTGYTAASVTAAPESDVWFETTLEGAGSLAFDWRTDCEHDDSGACEWDRLVVFVNGVEKARLDGTTDYQRVTLPLAGEKSVVRWSFYRDEHDEPGAPATPKAWVDGIRWTK